jgi:hypothetical protein
MKLEKKIQNPRSPIQNQTCVACGTPTERRFAKYCRVCGKFLFEEYQPLDNLRASYRMQGKTIVFEQVAEGEEVVNLFEINENGISQTTWACFVYSLVPYIDIIFIPLTLVFGSFSLVISAQKPALGGRKLALVSMTLSFVVLAIQILLWWLLYIIPTLGREF